MFTIWRRVLGRDDARGARWAARTGGQENSSRSRARPIPETKLELSQIPMIEALELPEEGRRRAMRKGLMDRSPRAGRGAVNYSVLVAAFCIWWCCIWAFFLRQRAKV